jgi:hypothetical protein
MGVKQLIFAAAILACMSLSLVAIGIAQEPTPQLSSIKHIPIALPEQVPFGWDPVTYANFRRRCQEVADLSAANLPMGSGDYGYAEACTERGAFFHPVKLLPKPTPLTPTPVVTPGPDGHIPLDIPVSPPPGSGRNPEEWTNWRKECQIVADKQAAHQPVDRDQVMDCGRMRMVVREYSQPASPVPATSPSNLSLPTITPTPEAGINAPQSLSSSFSIGPFGTPFPGGGGDTCTQGQPVDLAADVPPSQIAEFLNQGLCVFNKQGQPQPCSLSRDGPAGTIRIAHNYLGTR